jgi:hypothetical protein
MCGETDVLVAFVPEASMGTAIEMWEAAQHGKVVVAVSPLHLNWAIRFCSDIIYATFDELELAVATGNLQSRVRELQTHKMPSGKTT